MSERSVVTCQQPENGYAMYNSYFFPIQQGSAIDLKKKTILGMHKGGGDGGREKKREIKRYIYNNLRQPTSPIHLYRLTTSAKKNPPLH